MNGIVSVGTYTASPVETCDRCGQGIKYVCSVRFADGLTQRYGMDCIEKILSADNSILKLARKNFKALAQFKADLEILSRPVDQMPYDPSGYYNRGIYMVASSSGKGSMCHEHYYFHPGKFDDHASEMWDGQPKWKGGKWVPNTREQFIAESLAAIEHGKRYLTANIDRIEKFLARAIHKGLVTQSQLQTKTV